MSVNLDCEVLALLNARKGDWQKVATDSGVSYSWLSKFANGHINNPGFATLTKLRNHLKGPENCVAIEQATDGRVMRWDLRPDDWHRIWPELIGTPGAPAVPDLVPQS